VCKFSMLIKSCADVDILEKVLLSCTYSRLGLIVVNVTNRTGEGFGDFASG
jgi:hypothetical protein